MVGGLVTVDRAKLAAYICSFQANLVLTSASYKCDDLHTRLTALKVTEQKSIQRQSWWFSRVVLQKNQSRAKPGNLSHSSMTHGAQVLVAAISIH